MNCRKEARRRRDEEGSIEGGRCIREEEGDRRDFWREEMKEEYEIGERREGRKQGFEERDEEGERGQDEMMWTTRRTRRV